MVCSSLLNAAIDNLSGVQFVMVERQCHLNIVVLLALRTPQDGRLITRRATALKTNRRCRW